MDDSVLEGGKSGSIAFSTETTIQDGRCRRNHAIRTVERRNPIDRIHLLWDELNDFGPGSTASALEHCMRSICGWIGAQNAFWAGTVHMARGKTAACDPTLGWRIGGVHVLNNEYTSHERLCKWMQALRTSEPGQTTRAVVAAAGQFRVSSLGTGFVDNDAFQKTAHYDYFYREPGISDRIWAAFPVNVDTESLFVFDTYDAGRNFSTDELHAVSQALRGVKWFHCRLLLSRGLGISDKPLSPSEQRIIPELLTGAAEKLIAQRLNLTPATVHQYVTGVYRKFGVHGRTEFMSLWLHGRP